jgi:hypothetical protein
MNEHYKRDCAGGEVSCRNRVVSADPEGRDWCARFRDFCIYECVHKRKTILEPVKVIERPKVEVPPREWLLKRLAVGGGIAPEYGTAMLARIEQLECDSAPEEKQMQEYEQDDDGVVRCRYRQPSDDGDPLFVSFCVKSNDYCTYDANCRVPIPTNLSLISNAAEELARCCQELVDCRNDPPELYGDELIAAREAMAEVKALLKNQENNDAG